VQPLEAKMVVGRENDEYVPVHKNSRWFQIWFDFSASVYCTKCTLNTPNINFDITHCVVWGGFIGDNGVSCYQPIWVYFIILVLFLTSKMRSFQWYSRILFVIWVKIRINTSGGVHLHVFLGHFWNIMNEHRPTNQASVHVCMNPLTCLICERLFIYMHLLFNTNQDGDEQNMQKIRLVYLIVII
jgi:hypothetical protein